MKRTSFKSIALLKSLFDVELWVVIIYRISVLFAKVKLFPIAKIFWLVNRIVFSVDIDPRSDLAGGLILVHGFGIVIGHEVRSLGHLKIYQGATLGGNLGKREIIAGRNTGQPVICNNVTIGINSCVFGPILIEENVIVGAGAIVTKSVGSNKTVIGANKVIEHKI